MIERSWLIEEVKSLDNATLREMKRELSGLGTLRGGPEVPNLAVRIKDVVIFDNRKWFGEANIRLDVLVIHGRSQENKLDSFYTPGTFRFGRVADGDHLPIGESGLLVFYGKPLHFMDIFITVSRDRKDSDDLAVLLSRQLQSPNISGAIGTLLGLAVSVPHVAVVAAAVEAAAIVGNFAYQILQKVTENTIGLYRTSWLQHRDRFGIGRHPEMDSYLVKDLSFWYEILIEESSV